MAIALDFASIQYRVYSKLVLLEIASTQSWFFPGKFATK